MSSFAQTLAELTALRAENAATVARYPFSLYETRSANTTPATERAARYLEQIQSPVPGYLFSHVGIYKDADGNTGAFVRKEWYTPGNNIQSAFTPDIDHIRFFSDADGLKKLLSGIADKPFENSNRATLETAAAELKEAQARLASGEITLDAIQLIGEAPNSGMLGRRSRSFHTPVPPPAARRVAPPARQAHAPVRRRTLGEVLRGLVQRKG